MNPRRRLYRVDCSRLAPAFLCVKLKSSLHWYLACSINYSDFTVPFLFKSRCNLWDTLPVYINKEVYALKVETYVPLRHKCHYESHRYCSERKRREKKGTKKGTAKKPKTFSVKKTPYKSFYSKTSRDLSVLLWYSAQRKLNKRWISVFGSNQNFTSQVASTNVASVFSFPSSYARQLNRPYVNLRASQFTKYMYYFTRSISLRCSRREPCSLT